jgi:hypothetical protein
MELVPRQPPWPPAYFIVAGQELSANTKFSRSSSENDGRVMRLHQCFVEVLVGLVDAVGIVVGAVGAGFEIG